MWRFLSPIIVVFIAITPYDSIAQSEEWGESYRSYTIAVATTDASTVNLSYEIRFINDGKVGKYETTSLDTFLLLLTKDLGALPEDKSDLLFYIHGMFGGQVVNYNYSIKDFRQRYLGKPNSTLGRIIGYRWPAQNPIYTIDKENAHTIAESLSDNFNQITNAIRESGDHKINAITNSLGNELFKEMMRYELLREANPVQLNHIIISASDIADTVFEIDSTMHKALSLCEGMTVYFSQKDFTLGLSKNFNNENRLGLSGPSSATPGHSKLTFVEVTDISDEENLAWKMTGHSYVRSSDRISSDMLSSMMGVPANQVAHRKVQDESRGIYRLIPKSD